MLVIRRYEKELIIIVTGNSVSQYLKQYSYHIALEYYGHVSLHGERAEVVPAIDAE